jgi:hypothetical protein
MSEQPSPAEIAFELTRLHETKDTGYKDAWRKRGELLGIFCNVARKYDRLLVARDEADPDKCGARADTAADLCIYSLKYVTWLIERDADAAGAIAAADSERWSSTLGHAAVASALEQLAAEQTAPPLNLDAAFDAVGAPFASLEQILVGQQQTASATRLTLAWELAGAALAYLWRLALDEPEAWQRFTADVADAA